MHSRGCGPSSKAENLPIFERAVFLTENAWYGGKLDSVAFDLSIRSMAHPCERVGKEAVVIRNEKRERPLALQYAIDQLLKDTIQIASQEGIFRTQPYRYNIQDFDGRVDWSNQFVTKLLAEGQGTCRSLPYLYKILSDRLELETWLSLAPNHIYIKHRDAGKRSEGWQRRMHNVELTNGSFPTDGWLMAPGYITLTSIREGLYMRGLTDKESVVQCVIDLANGYTRQSGQLSDGFVTECVALALPYDSLNINARLLEIRLAREAWQKSGKKRDLQTLEALCKQLVAQGYREMPAQMYLNWLFELRATENPLDSVRYLPKRYPKPDSLNGLPVLTLTDGYFDEFPDWADSTRTAGVIFDLKAQRVVGIVEPDSLQRGEPWAPTLWLSVDPISHPYQSPYVAFDDNPIFYVDPNGTTVGDYYTRSGSYLGSDGIDDGKNYIVNNIEDIHSMQNDVQVAINSGGSGIVDKNKYCTSDYFEIPSSVHRKVMERAVRLNNVSGRGAGAQIAFAPAHALIQHRDSTGQTRNLGLTSGATSTMLPTSKPAT